MVHCHDAAARSLVAKVQGEVFVHFHVVTTEHNCSMWNSLFWPARANSL
jgi:hypothetical protein